MYGQTISMYKTLVDAYRTVLLRMRENNLVLPMTMIMAMVGGGAVAQKAAAANVYWAPAINNATTPWDGAWDTGSTNWNPNNPALTPSVVPYGVQTWNPGDTAIFARPPAIGATADGPPPVGGEVPIAPYTVTVTENVDVGGIQFTHPGYTLLRDPNQPAAIILSPGGTLWMGTLIAGSPVTSASPVAIDATIDCTIASTGGIVKDGGGTLYLTGTNNGVTSTTGFKTLTVNAGRVQIGESSGSGTSGTLGTDNVTLNGATTQLRFARADTTTVSNVIGGTGSVAQVGTGMTVLTGGNGYSGGTIITRGTLRLSDNPNGGGGTLGSGVVNNNALLEFNRNAVAISNVISGAGDIANIGGTSVLSGNNGYTGKTTVSAGNMRFDKRLSLSGGLNWDAAHIHVMGGATLTLNLDSNAAIPGGFNTGDLSAISGLAHSTNNVQDGGFRKDAILAVDTGGAVGPMPDAGTVFNHGGLGNTGGNLSFTKLGTGTFNFGGAVSYTGTTTFRANSILGFKSGTLSGNIVTNAPTTDLYGHIVMSGNNADATLAGGDVLTLSGTNTYTGTTTVDSGTLHFTKREALYNGGWMTVATPPSTTPFLSWMWDSAHIQVASGATLALSVGGTEGFDVDDVEEIYYWSGGFAAGAILGLDTATATVPFGSDEPQFVYDTGITDTFNGSLGLAKRGEGTLILTQDNTYTGPTYIYAGTLQLGEGGSTGGIDFSSSITNNGTLAVNLDRPDAVLNNIHGTGNVSQLGSGTTTMQGLNDYKGDTLVRAGTLRAASTTAFGDYYTASVAPDVVLGKTASMTVASNATLDLDGYSNTVGTLLGQGHVTLGSGALTFAGGRGVASEFAGDITGAGGITMDADALQKADILAYGTTSSWVATTEDSPDPRQIQILSGNNTYAGTTVINYGTLQVGNGGLAGTLGSGDITVGSDPAADTSSTFTDFDGNTTTLYGLMFNRGGTITLGNALHGTGSVGIVGTGTVEFSGTSDHTGEIAVKSGILKVTGSMQSDIAVDPEVYTTSTTSGQTTVTTDRQKLATLAGNGSTTGQLTLAGGSFILGANSGQAFKALGGASVNSTFLWTWTTTGSGSSWSTTVKDKVTVLDGSTGAGLHTIDVLEYAGGSPGASNFDASGFRGGVLNDDGSKITLTYERADRVWNSGLGAWDNLVSAPWTGTDTLDGTGANLAKKFSSGDYVRFDDTGAGTGGTRTVNLNTQVAPGGVTFDNTNSRYVITGTGGITGITNVVKNGTETTVFDTDNSYTGTTTVNTGVLRIGNGGTRGTLGQGDVTLNGNSVLLFGRGDDSSVDALSGDYSPTTTVVRASSEGNWHPVLINNNIGGTGSVGQIGTLDNTVILTGNNTYSGSTSVNSGTLAAGSDTAFGLNSATTVDLGAILWINDGIQDHDISLGSLSGGGFVVANGVSRGANLTLTFAGNAAGSSTVFNGQLSDINRRYTFTVGQTVNDRIRITDANGNSINYQNERSVAGLLVDSAGVHKEVGGIWVDSTSGTVTEPAENLRGKTWVVDPNGGIATWYKVMYIPVAGNGWDNSGMPTNLIKEGVGTQTLAGDNTYTGQTIINGGTLQVGNGGSLSNRNTDLFMGGQLLDAHGTLGQTSAVSIASGATLAFNRVDNALVWGADAWVGNYLYAGGKKEDLNYTWPDRVRGALVVSADISGDGTIRQIGTGTTTLTGDQSGFTGAVVVDAGTLRIGDEIIDTIVDLAHTGTDIVDPHLHQGLQEYADGAALGAASSTVTVNNGGTLAFNLANDYTETHAITGAGNVAQTGSNVQTMAGDSTYTGKTTVASTVARYRVAGPVILTNITVPDSELLHYDLVIGGTLRAGVDSVLNTAGTSAVSGAFGVQSVVSVNAGVTLDLNGHSQYIGALQSDGSLVRDASGNWVEDAVDGVNRHALTDGNSRVAEYAPSAEQHAGTAANRLGTAGTAVVNFYQEVDNAYHSSSIAVGVVNIGSATLVVGDGNKSGDYAGVLTGAGTLVKIGTGTQILSGDSDGPVTGRDYTWLSLNGFAPESFSGEVHIRGGTLQLGDGTFDPLGNSHGSIGTGHVAISSGATFAFNRQNDTTLAVVNQISGQGNVRQFGLGTTVLSGNNTYTGITQVDAGILRAGGDFAFGTPVTTNLTTVTNTIGSAVVNGGMLDLNSRNIQFGSLNGSGGIVNLGTSPTASLTVGWFGNPNDAYAGVIQGAGSLIKTGLGTQTLLGANTYTGATNVVAGTLQAGVATVGGINPTSGAFGVNSAMTLGGTMFGSPTTGTVDLNGFDQTIGSLASTNDLGNTVTNTSAGADVTLTITGASSADFQGTLSDGTSKKINLVKTGSGTQTFSGQFTYTGTTTINGGKLVLDYADMVSAPQKGALSLGGGELQFNNLGGLTQTFVSTTIAASNDNKLTLGSGWTGSGATPTGVNLGTLNYVSGALDVSNITTTAGWVKISGIGGQSSYTNQTFLFNGIVTANGGVNLVGTDANGYLITAQTADFSQGGAIGNPAGPAVPATSAIRLISTGFGGNLINADITLYNSGTTDVATVLNAYTGEAPGQPNRTDGLPVETLLVGSGKTLRLAAQGAIISTAGSDLVIKDGTLTAGGAADAAGMITVNAGARSASDPIAVTVSSAIADNGLGEVGLTKVGTGTLVIASAGGVAWDLNNPTGHPATGSTYSGATTIAQGTLKVGADYAMSYRSQVVLNAGVFTPGTSGSPGTWVSPVFDLDNHNVRIGSLQDGADVTGNFTGATVALGTGGLTLGEGLVNAVDTATFSGVISSGSTSNGLTKVGAGTQILAGDNTFSGPVNIYEGTLQLGNGGTTGTFGPSLGGVNTGTATANGILAFDRSDLAPVTFAPNITGFGGVTQKGTGTVVLAGNNTYGGDTMVNRGVLQAGSTQAFGSGSDVTVASGAALDLADFNNSIGSLAGSGGVSLGSATLTTGVNNASASFSGTISGTGGLTKTGTGTQTITGINTYSGPTTVSQGTLALDYSAGSNRLAAGSSLVLEGGSIVFQNLGNRTQSFASTQVLLDNPGTPFQLSQTGWTTGVVDLGILGDVASGTASWIGSLDIQDLNRTRTWIRTSDSRYASTLNWSGKATSSGERVATDANGYFILVNTTDYSQGGAIGDPAGPPFTSADVVRLISTGFGGNQADAPITLDAGGTTDVGGILNAYDAGTTNPSSNTSVTLEIGASQTLRVGSFGVSASGAGTDLAVSGGQLTSSTAEVAFNAGTRTITVDSAIVDNGISAVGLTQNGGTTVLTGTNTYTGPTTVSNGLLQIGDGAAAGSISAVTDITVDADGSLSWNRNGNLTINNTIDGAGTLSQDGAQQLTLTDLAGFTGEIQVNQGSMNIASAAAGPIALAEGIRVADDTTLALTGANTHVILNGDSSNVGLVRVNAGSRLDVNQDIAGNGVINNFGTLNFADGVDVVNAITNNGDALMRVAGEINTGSILFTQGGTLAVGGTSLINATHVPTGETQPTAAQAGPAVVIQSGAKLLVESTALAAVGDAQLIIHTEADSGGVSGKFAIDAASIVAPGAVGARTTHFYTASTANDVYLGVQWTINGGTITKPTTQQTEMIEGITAAGEQAGTSQNGDIQDAIYDLAGLNGAALTGAINGLTGHDRAAIDNAAIRQSHLLGQGLARFAQFNLGADPEAQGEIARASTAMRATALGDVQDGILDEESHGLRFFTRFSHVTEDKNGQANGVLASESTGNVFTVGLHNQLSSDWNIGMAFTYDAADLSSANGLGSSEAKTYGLDAYFSHLMGEAQDWFISGDVGFGVGSYDNERKGVGPDNLTATSSTDATNFHAAAMLGQRLEVATDAILTPYAGLSYVRNAVDAYEESLPGAPGLALAYGKKTLQSTESILGVDFAKAFDLGGGYALTPSAGLAWHHQLSNNDAAAVDTHFVGASGTSFNTYLGTPSKDAVEMLGGLTLKAPGGVSGFVNIRSYKSLGGSNSTTQNSIGAGLSIDF